MEERYVGPHKVMAAVIQEQTTPGGLPLVEIRYEAENLASEIMPQHVFEQIATSEPTDFTSLRERRYAPLIIALAEVVLESDIMFSDMAYVAKQLVNKLEDSFECASSLLWTGNPKAWISGIDYRSNLTILAADRILKNGNKTD